MELQISRKIFNEAYIPSLLDYEKRYQVYYGGAGSGKSHFLASKLIIKALNDKRKILVLRKVGKTVKQSVFQQILDILVDWKIVDRCRINRTDFTIELPNGSIFLCSGLDDPEKIKSIAGLTDAWLEEATEFSQEDFNQIDLRIRHVTAANQNIYLSFNPVSKANWCYKLFFNNEFENEEETKKMASFREKVEIIHTSYKDNKYLPQDFINSLLLLEATNPAYYKIYALGEFGSLDKLIFNRWKVEEFDHMQINGELMCGLDFGFVNDPTALVCSLLDETNKRIYIFDEVQQKGLLNNDIVQLLKDKGLSKSVIIADSAEQKSIEEIKRSGITRIKPAVKGQGSILQGIQKLQQYEIIIHPSCKHIIEEFKNYSWTKDKKTGEYINTPIDKYNHGIDALRYSLQCVNSKLKVLDKAVLGL